MLPLAIVSNLFSGDGLIIFLILLLLFGAKKLPELAKGLGSAVREFSKAKDEIHHEMTRAAEPQRPPQIEPPKYTEPQHGAGIGSPEYVAPVETVAHDMNVAEAAVKPQPSVYGSAEMPVTSPAGVTEEDQHHTPVGRTS